MAISKGSYTIGSGGNYATIFAFWQDIDSEGLTGNLTGTVITDCDIHPSTTYSTTAKKLNGFTLEITTSVYHDGYDKTSAPAISLGDGYIPSSVYGIQLNVTTTNHATSKLHIHGLKFKTRGWGAIGIWVTFVGSSYNAGTLDISYNTFFFISGGNALQGTRQIYLTDSYNGFKTTNIYRNTFVNFIPTVYKQYVISADNYSYKKIENNTFINCKYCITAGAGNLTIDNNIFCGTTTTFVNTGGTLAHTIRGNATNLTGLEWLGWDAANLMGVAFNSAGDAYFKSYDITSPDFAKLTDGTALISLAPTVYVPENISGIRLNVVPNAQNQYSTGADQFTPITDVSLGGFDLPYPQYPYKTDIFFSWDCVKSSTDKYHFFDNGALYDKRKCVATFLLSETEAEKLKQLWNSYKTSYTTTPLSLIMGDDSGWFPFGQDKGNKGQFKVELNLLSKIERSKTHFNYFEATLELINVDAYPDYTFVDEVNEGSFAISNATSTYSISNIRTPEYEVEGQYGTFTNQNEGGIDYNRTIELNEETQETRFILNTNLSKMQRVLKLITDNRTGNYTISDGGGNIFGYSFNLLQENLKLVENKFTVTANKFNDYTIDLRFTNE